MAEIDAEIAREIIQKIAAIADDVAAQAGVGGMETAGGFVSFLAANPDHIADFLNESGGAVDWPVGWHRHGCLSWHGANGNIYTPEHARRQILINAMIKGATQ